MYFIEVFWIHSCGPGKVMLAWDSICIGTRRMKRDIDFKVDTRSVMMGLNGSRWPSNDRRGINVSSIHAR